MASAAEVSLGAPNGAYNVSKVGRARSVRDIGGRTQRYPTSTSQCFCPTFVKTNIANNLQIEESAARLRDQPDEVDRHFAGSSGPNDSGTRNDRGQTCVVPQLDAKICGN